MISIAHPSDFVRLPLRFKPGGRSLEGADCWGLYWLANKLLLGRELPSYSGEYQTELDYAEIERLIHQERDLSWNCIWRHDTPKEQRRKEEYGDGILIRLARGRNCHVGFVLPGKKMLHIDEGVEASIERYDDIRWGNRVIGIYRYAKFDHGR